MAIAPGAGAAEVIHPKPQGPARGTAARAQNDARGAGFAAGGDIGGEVDRAQAVELVKALFQVAQVQRLAEHPGKRAAQGHGQALVSQLNGFEVAFFDVNIQRLAGGRCTDQVRPAGDVTGLDVQLGDLRQQAVDLGDAHARRHIGLDAFVQLGTVEQRDPGQARAI